MYLLCCVANPSKPRNHTTNHCGALSSSGIAPSPSTDIEKAKGKRQKAKGKRGAKAEGPFG
jgi:hypothetical protein